MCIEKVEWICKFNLWNTYEKLSYQMNRFVSLQYLSIMWKLWSRKAGRNNHENNYEVHDIKGINEVRIDITGKEGFKSFIMDSYKFHQQLGTFLNSDDDYRINYLANNARVNHVL